MSTTSDYVLNTCTIDYIRVATFDFKLYCDISAKMDNKYTGWRSTKWLQYKMRRSQDNVSYGIGEQQKRPHGIFESSGSKAHEFAHWIFRTQQLNLDKLYCTRIDLQVTREFEQRPDYHQLYKRQRKPAQLILGDTGNTLYIGNRESDTFWRLYDKTPTEIRLEVEIKGNQAKSAFNAFMHNASVKEIYQTYLRKSRVPAVLANKYMISEDVLDMSEYRIQADDDMQKKLAWLKQLDELVHKLCNDHDTHDEMLNILSRWTEYATKA